MNGCNVDDVVGVFTNWMIVMEVTVATVMLILINMTVDVNDVVHAIFATADIVVVTVMLINVYV